MHYFHCDWTNKYLKAFSQIINGIQNYLIPYPLNHQKRILDKNDASWTGHAFWEQNKSKLATNSLYGQKVQNVDKCLNICEIK